LSHEWNMEELSEIENLAPFWEWNGEPVFLLENIRPEKVEKVGKNWGSHLKITWRFWEKTMTTIFWWKWDEAEKIWDKISVIWNIKRDTFNGGFYFHWTDLI
jgi:single-stranded DNA-specific DHH superfamily exonuclease